ncbi:MAG: MATE family efflux transporter [Lachnospiraceae bacterium]
MQFTNQDLKKLIIPLVVEQFLAVSVGMADTMMISSVGEAAISGVSLVDMINNLIITLFASMATGGAVVASQYIGRKDSQHACQSANQLVIIMVTTSILVAVVFLIFRHPILRLFFGSIEADVMDACLIYLVISALSYPFLSLYNGCAALFRAMENSKISMTTSIIMNVVNIIGNAIFIYIFEWGIAGAALASLIGRALACVIIFCLLKNETNPIHRNKITKIRLDMSMIRRILHIGIPGGLEGSIFQLGRVLVVSIISGFGTVQIAANAVANNLDGMGCIPSQALNLAMVTVVGQCIGAGDTEQAKYYTKKILKIAYICGGLWNLLILVTMPLTLNVYSLTAESRQLAMILILIHDGCAIFLWPASFTLPNALRAANDVRFPMVLSIGSMFVFRIGLSILLGIFLGWGAIGVWIGMVVDWMFRVSAFVWRFVSGKWLKFYQEA